MDQPPIIWPDLDQELAPFKAYLSGVVLNAGSGTRKLDVGARVINVDIDARFHPDIVASLLDLPVESNSVDSVLSIAAIEHVERPWVAFEEFFRVLKPGGYAVVAAPFLQPEHACPGDFYRFTARGLEALAKYAGFTVVKTERVHHFGLTLGWLLWEYLYENRPKNDRLFRFLRWLIGGISRSRLLKRESSKTNNTYYIVVQKAAPVLNQ